MREGFAQFRAVLGIVASTTGWNNGIGLAGAGFVEERAGVLSPVCARFRSPVFLDSSGGFDPWVRLSLDECESLPTLDAGAGERLCRKG